MVPVQRFERREHRDRVRRIRRPDQKKSDSIIARRQLNFPLVGGLQRRGLDGSEESRRRRRHSAASVPTAGREEGENEHAERHDSKKVHGSILNMRGGSGGGAAHGHASAGF